MRFCCCGELDRFIPASSTAEPRERGSSTSRGSCTVSGSKNGFAKRAAARSIRWVGFWSILKYKFRIADNLACQSPIDDQEKQHDRGYSQALGVHLWSAP